MAITLSRIGGGANSTWEPFGGTTWVEQLGFIGSAAEDLPLTITSWGFLQMPFFRKIPCFAPIAARSSGPN